MFNLLARLTGQGQSRRGGKKRHGARNASPRTASSRHRRLAAEPLEDRRLLSLGYPQLVADINAGQKAHLAWRPTQILAPLLSCTTAVSR